MSVTAEQVNDILSRLADPNTGADYVSSRSVRNVQIDGADVALTIELGYPAQGQADAIRDGVTAALRSLPGVGKLEVSVASKIVPHTVQRGLKPQKNVKNVIAVASGKGGVGKSTVAVNLALALAAEGATVGLLDADIYGPSQPTMLGIRGKPKSPDGKSLDPMERHGIQASSIGFLAEDPDDPMIWRGPMVTQALVQLFEQTNWRDLDYLVIDMPPGTGDIQLTLAQKIPVTAAVVVTTPQDIALIDAIKGLRMFEKVNIPVLGIIENMALHVCTNCGHAEHVFGQGGGARIGERHGVELLGSLPLAMSIRAQTDAGTPPVAAEPDGPIAALYREIARKVAAKIAQRPKDTAHKFPTVTVQQNA
jgi:ATP-binding protein involved in chromosome partitioning